MKTNPARALLPEMPPHVASEFILWLTWNEAMGDNAYSLPGEDRSVTIAVDGDVDLKLPEEERASVVLRGLGSNEHPELLASLRAGRVLHKIKLRVSTGEDREYGLTLTGPQLAWGGVRLPKLMTKGEEGLLEELFLYEDLHHAVNAVFAQFVERRVDASRWSQEGNSIRSWLGATFARVFSS